MLRAKEQQAIARGEEAVAAMTEKAGAEKEETEVVEEAGTEEEGTVEGGAEETEDLYYLAGDYDPVVGTINFKPGVVKT